MNRTFIRNAIDLSIKPDFRYKQNMSKLIVNYTF